MTPFVCGPDGRPLRVYHGTGAVFEEFDGQFSNGMFCFTDCPSVASTVALSPHAESVGGIANVRMAYLVMNRPIYAHSADDVTEATEAICSGTLDADGIIWNSQTMVEPGFGPWTQYFVFNVKQIRPPWD